MPTAAPLTLALAHRVAAPLSKRPAWPRPFVDVAEHISGAGHTHAALIDGDSSAVAALRADDRLVLGVRPDGTAWRWRGGVLTALHPSPDAWLAPAHPPPAGFTLFGSDLQASDVFFALDQLLSPEVLAASLPPTTTLDELTTTLLPPGLTGLVLQATEQPPATSLDACAVQWAQRGFELSYIGNEGGGPITTFVTPWPDHALTPHEALLAAARRMPEVTTRLAEHIACTDPWDHDPEPGFVPFLEPDGSAGWIFAEGLDHFSANAVAVRADWLDPATPLARTAEVEHLRGPLVVDALREHVESIDLLALHSAPSYDQSVIAIHLLGGRDHKSGALVGVRMERIWT